MKTNLVRILALSAIAAAAGSAQQVDKHSSPMPNRAAGEHHCRGMGCGRDGSKLSDGRAHP